MNRPTLTGFVILALLAAILGYGGWVTCIEVRLCPVPPPEVPLTQLRADFEQSNLFISAMPPSVGEPTVIHGRPAQAIQPGTLQAFAVHDWLVFSEDQTLVVQVSATVLLSDSRAVSGIASLAYRKNSQNQWAYLGDGGSLELQNPRLLAPGP